ncbi:MAG: aminotransferase class I/II-fold pyridoxal phosphate-dependent enzyme [Anaerolineae bacterium]|nr:aminotransferase class I/II-fold pyridoxal phosphate-dependent enzyme [Anaerolineae bacterium]MDW8300369.1 aminotransferase class I/II-fold pyridoxal phosphate-dependent enzyme [Anaerolineae bacterium]
MSRMAQRVASFGTTIFAEINRLARQHGAINLGQGAPDFDAPSPVLEAAIRAICSQLNQYAPNIGLPEAREAIARHAERFYGQRVAPDHVLITAGATEAMFAAILGLSDPGDEIIVFQPVYDSYVPNMRMAGVLPRYVNLYPPDWTFDPDELAAAFTPRTKAIIINTPHNPTGKCYARHELEIIAELCLRHNVIAITDEVYEHITYDGVQHVRLATLDGMADRTLTISSLGKTFSATGWKVGWAIGAPELVESVNRAHQFITYSVATPLQAAAATALNLPDSYFESLRAEFQRKRDWLLEMLRSAGFQPLAPQGSYFIMVDWRGVAPEYVRNDVQFAEWLIREVGVACIPPSAFYRAEDKHLAAHFARFAVCKRDETLQAAAERLAAMRVSGD